MQAQNTDPAPTRPDLEAAWAAYEADHCVCGHLRKHHDEGNPHRCWKCGCCGFFRNLAPVHIEQS